MTTELRLEVDREDDGRWLAEVFDLPGSICYGEICDGCAYCSPCA